MEFFDLFNFVYSCTGLFNADFSWLDLWVSIGVGGGLYLVCLLFGGLGLYVMATRMGMKNPWLGFIPFANTYYAGKVAGEAKFFGQKMKRHGLYAMLLEIVYVIIGIFSICTNVFLLNPEFWVETVDVTGNVVSELKPSLIPEQYQWVLTANLWCEILSYLFNIILLIMMWVVYYALFRKYYIRGPMIMTLLSVILPFRGIVIFAVRKNSPVDYNEVMRKRMEAMYRAQNPNYNPNGGSNEPSPFSDFGGVSGGKKEQSPFSEFDDNPTDHKDE